MKLPLSPLNKTKIGTCPHGLPIGACPICNGAGGGGGVKKSTPKPTGEMSWDECYVVWQQMLKAKEIAQQKKEQSLAQAQVQVNFTEKLANSAEKIATIAQKLTEFVQNKQKSPSIFAKTLVIAAKIAIPILNVIKNIPAIAQKAINFVQQKLADISDKLNAIFGELKNAIEKKLSDKFKDFKKKFKSLFGIFEPAEVTQEEEEKIEESKRLFELKTVLHNLKEKFKKPKENIENGS